MKANLKSILYNKYFNLNDLYWMLFYAFGFSTIAGIGNAATAISQTTEMSFLFFQGFVNNLILSIPANIFYAKIVNVLITKSRPRLYANSANIVIQTIFLIWHFISGTQNPIQTMVLPIITSLFLTNYHVTKVLSNKKTKNQ